MGLRVYGNEGAPGLNTFFYADYVLGDGPQCASNNQEFWVDVSWNKALSYGTAVDIDMFIVIPGYFSPRYPNGDKAVRLALPLAYFGGPQGSDSMSSAAVSIRLL